MGGVPFRTSRNFHRRGAEDAEKEREEEGEERVEIARQRLNEVT